MVAASEHGSVRSKRTMTGSELKNFFNRGQEDIKSKYSNACPESIKSKVSSYRAKLMRKLEAQLPNEDGEEEDEREEADITMDKTKDDRTYEVASPNRTPEGKKEKDDDELTDDDDITLESS